MAATGKSYNLSVVVQAVDKITGPLKRVNAAVSATAARISGIGNSVRNLGDRAGLPVLANAFGKVGSAAWGLGKRIALVGAGIATFAAAGIAALVPLAKAYADATGAIGDLANQTGASRTRIQELGYAAQLTGSSSEALGNALQKMNLAVGKARSGSKDLKEMFAGLNIQLKNSNGTLKSTDELFDMFVNRISRIKDPSLQAKAAVTIFGKSATELLPLLRSGNKGIAEMAAEARRLGVVLSDEAVGQGEEFGDILDKLSYAVKGASNSFISNLIPALSKLANQLVETIVKYRPQIEAFAASFGDKLPGYIQDVSDGVGRFWAVLEPLGKALAFVSQNASAVSLAFDVLAGLLIATMLPPVITLTQAFWGLGAAILATPIGWFIAGAAAIAGAAVLIYKNWDDFSGFFIDKFNAVKTAFGEGFVKGLLQLWLEFNPVTFILDSLNSLVKFATGIDIGGILKEKLGLGEVKVEVPGAGTIPPAFDPKAPSNGPLAKGGEKQPFGGNPEYTAVPENGPIAAGLNEAKAKITMDFKNLPQGTTIDTTAGQGVKVQTNQGYSMMAPQ